MSKNKLADPALKARLEKALRENLKKRKMQQRERKDNEEKLESTKQNIAALDGSNLKQTSLN